jgi:hypothetical protein
MTPRRIQLCRVKGWRLPDNTVVVSRPSKWGNPYPVAPHRNREQAALLYWAALITGVLPYTVADVRRELRGKNLACWCPIGLACHADALLEIANAEVKP